MLSAHADTTVAAAMAAARMAKRNIEVPRGEGTGGPTVREATSDFRNFYLMQKSHRRVSIAFQKFLLMRLAEER